MAGKRKKPETSAAVDDTKGFDSFGLDARLVQAIKRQQFERPTLVQSTAIPLALEGKDIVARAKTGSGKTAAYVIPVVEAILRAEKGGERSTKAIVLVPTRELAEQAVKLISKLTAYCSKVVRTASVAQNVSEQVQQSLLAERPEIVVGTPSRVLAHVKAGNLGLRELRHLVIDEADLVTSYGYEEDMAQIAKAVSSTVQVFLMSATLTDEVEQLKTAFCRNPAILRLEEDEVDAEAQLKQYTVRTTEFDKFLLAYVIFKLGLIKGKTLVFVNDVERSYRLKLFLEQFGIRSCVLNSDLPLNTRLHVMEQFNKNIYNLVIATDEADEQADEDAEDAAPAKRTKRTREREYGVARGIDFQHVSCVLNFDLPTTARAYTHRVGRTARAGNAGMALSFVVPRDEFGKHKVASTATAKRDEKVLARIERDQLKRADRTLEPYLFDMGQVNAFRYRCEDAFRAVTAVAVRDARYKELKQELLSSEKLKRHFEENPDELDALRHDNELHAAKVQHHLKHVPDYLMPKSGSTGLVKNLGHVGLHKAQGNRIRRARAAAKGRKRRTADPLKSFKVRK
ncbi:P-loop containing nucleoside triphosphate hydrolase protein [Dipodascopsis tothii]|uniref:P-loop containing nucleoside triphosphate hydrolase protein n=1 Tax=Dipodascopsis tothii TaxID=44089 RepID=UPI0034CDC3E0